MKKQLTPEQKIYRDNRDRKIIGLAGAVAVLAMGAWMLISPAKPKHASVEKATVSVVKDLWGMEAGIALTLLGSIWFIYGFIKLRKFQKASRGINQ